MGDHSEVIRVEFDPRTVSYESLLAVFWDSHDPEYEPFSRQYRQAVFVLDETQRQFAERSLQKLTEQRGLEIRTAIEAAGAFYPAEAYHQKYLLRKADGLFREFMSIYPDENDFVASTAAARVNGYLGCNGDPEVLNQEFGALGLSLRSQQQLHQHLTTSCGRFSGLTCPSPN